MSISQDVQDVQDLQDFLSYLSTEGELASEYTHEIKKYSLKSFIPQFEKVYRAILQPSDKEERTDFIAYGILEHLYSQKRYSRVYLDKESLEKDQRFYKNSGVTMTVYDSFPYEVLNVAVSGYMTEAIDVVLSHLRDNDDQIIHYFPFIIQNGYVYLNIEYQDDEISEEEISEDEYSSSVSLNSE